MRMKKTYAAAGAACLMAVLAAGCANTGTSAGVSVPNEMTIRQYQEENGGQVTVESTSTVTAVPDVAELSLSIYSEDQEAAACQKKNEEALSKTLDYLKTQGIEEGNIQTSGYNLSPRYQWTEDHDQVLNGYEMITQITVSGVPIGKVGDLLGGTVASGTNSIDYVKYMCSDYDTVYEEALKQAVEQAWEKAEAMGEAGGFQVLEVKNISEYGENQAVHYARPNAVAEAGKETLIADTASMSVEEGELEIQAHLSVSFKIVPR